ncbi:hypothetical protein [Bacteroides thetaiotaomicron]|uniref:hypothetical protein n=1 Tax=Bacteroides thetaiotaomicron TaxID=818 RepID=UPI002165ED85|nr:hypothetical protein [Bacteroides thetaiotaomicron]MCS3041987.1 hypothetical protein [Bacteroides thetaiotaomicron]
MALFVNPGKDWEKNMSEEDIAQMESQGYDVTELRAKRAKSTEEEEKRAPPRKRRAGKLQESD